MKHILYTSIIISVLLNLIFISYLIIRPSQTNLSSQFYSQYPYLARRIFAENPYDILINFTPLRKKLKNYLNKFNKRIGMYFEYLPSGVSIGINEKDNFILASLLKVPLVMAVYKNIEEGKISKDDILIVKKEHIDSLFGDLWKRGVGTKITVAEAIRLTLVDSDNTAKSLLYTHIPDNGLDEVFDYLDIPKDLAEDNPVVTAKNYSSILRSLYLASYVSKENSNEILKLLTVTPFNDKIAAGVPSNIDVAHKIGIINIAKDKSIYTDCGIVYPPERPYVLCIMIESSENEAKTIMKTISQMTYEYVSQSNK